MSETALAETAKREISTAIALTADHILALSHEEEYAGKAHRKERIDSFFEIADTTTRGDYCMGTLSQVIVERYQACAQDPQVPMMNRVVAAWAALGAEGHHRSMQIAFKKGASDVAQTEEGKKALTTWLSYENAKGLHLCPDRRIALQETTKALKLDLV